MHRPVEDVQAGNCDIFQNAAPSGGNWPHRTNNGENPKFEYRSSKEIQNRHHAKMQSRQAQAWSVGHLAARGRREYRRQTKQNPLSSGAVPLQR